MTIRRKIAALLKSPSGVNARDRLQQQTYEALKATRCGEFQRRLLFDRIAELQNDLVKLAGEKIVLQETIHARPAQAA